MKIQWTVMILWLCLCSIDALWPGEWISVLKHYIMHYGYYRTESWKISQTLGIKCHNTEIVQAFVLKLCIILVRDTWESDGINHLSTTRAPWWETEELALLGGCILKECYNFQTKWARALKIVMSVSSSVLSPGCKFRKCPLPGTDSLYICE
jgi:hypothetical protein